MIIKTSWKIGPEMLAIWAENEGKNYQHMKPNTALETAALVPSMLVMLGMRMPATATQWFQPTPISAFLDEPLKQCVTLRECLQSAAHRMATIVDFVGNMIGVTMYLYNLANTELCIIQALIDPSVGAVKEVKQIPPTK